MAWFRPFHDTDLITWHILTTVLYSLQPLPPQDELMQQDASLKDREAKLRREAAAMEADALELEKCGRARYRCLLLTAYHCHARPCMPAADECSP